MSNYLQRVIHPHKHAMPMGRKFSDPANDRKCFAKNGTHRGTEVIKCAIDKCEHKFGIQCVKCKRVV